MDDKLKNKFHLSPVFMHIGFQFFQKLPVIEDYWWLLRVTLVVVFSFLPQNIWRWWGPMNDSFALK